MYSTIYITITAYKLYFSAIIPHNLCHTDKTLQVCTVYNHCKISCLLSFIWEILTNFLSAVMKRYQYQVFFRFTQMAMVSYEATTCPCSLSWVLASLKHQSKLLNTFYYLMWMLNLITLPTLCPSSKHFTLIHLPWQSHPFQQIYLYKFPLMHFTVSESVCMRSFLTVVKTYAVDL